MPTNSPITPLRAKNNINGYLLGYYRSTNVIRFAVQKYNGRICFYNQDTNMKRVMIIGQPGAGKSTLARLLGERTGLPVIHIDKIHWKPGWIERDAKRKRDLCREVHKQAEWIFEGGHSITWEERRERCDTLIWLDLPLWLRAWRVVARTLRNYGHSRPDLPENCPEQFRLEFYVWIWRTRKTARAKMGTLFETTTPPKVRIKLRNQREVAAFLSQFSVQKEAIVDIEP